MLWRLAIIVSLVMQPLLGLGAVAHASRPAGELAVALTACCTPSENDGSCCPMDTSPMDACGCAAPSEPIPEPAESARTVERSPLLAPVVRSVVSWPTPRAWPALSQCLGVPHRDAPALERLCVWLT